MPSLTSGDSDKTSGGGPRGPPPPAFIDVSSWVHEDPEARIPVAREDHRSPEVRAVWVVVNERLDAPEVVPLGIEVRADLDELAGARVGRWIVRIVRRACRALDLDRDEPAGVVRQIRQAGVLRIDRDLVNRQVAEALRERRIESLGDRELVDVLERLGVDQVDITPGVELRRQRDRLAGRADRRKRRVGTARAVLRVVALDAEDRVADRPAHEVSRDLGLREHPESGLARRDASFAVEDNDRVVAGRGRVVDLVLEEASAALDYRDRGVRRGGGGGAARPSPAGA